VRVDRGANRGSEEAQGCWNRDGAGRGGENFPADGSALGLTLIGKKRQGHRRPNSNEGGVGTGEGVASKHQELKAHLLEVLGRGRDDLRWVSHGASKRRRRE
jgi:hypothetical protein